MLTITDYLIIAAYFLVILVVGALTGRKQEKEEFLISGRKLTSLQATSTIFSSRIGAAILLTYTALVYMYGMGALWYFIGSVFGLFVFYFFGLKVKKLADKEKFYTMPDFFFFLKGKTAGYLATLITIIIMFGWVVLNFTAGAKLVSEYTPISYNLSVIIVGVIILFYLLAGGFDAVVKTDIVQTFGIFLLVCTDDVPAYHHQYQTRTGHLWICSASPSCRSSASSWPDSSSPWLRRSSGKGYMPLRTKNISGEASFSPPCSTSLLDLSCC